MTTASINEKRNKIIDNIDSRRLAVAFELLHELIQELSVFEFNDDFEQNMTAYKYMLDYFESGVIDKERESIYNSIREKLYTTVDNIAIEGFTKIDGTSGPFQLKKKLQQNSISIADLIGKHKDVASVIDNFGTTNDIEPVSLLTYRKQLEQLDTDIFNYAWLTFPMKHDDSENILRFLHDSDTPSFVKELIISGLGLGLIGFYDSEKCSILADIYISESEAISLKALCMIVIAVFLHHNRFDCSTNDTLHKLTARSSYGDDVRQVILELLKCNDSDRVSQKIHQDIIPELMNMYPDFMKKIKAEDFNVDDLSDMGDNPVWKNFIKEEKFTKKIEELNKMQEEGGDVFGGMFATLKSFSFFDKVANWFIPFVGEHSELAHLQTKELSSVLKSISVLNTFCNSDKYSLCLMLKNIPEAQKQMIMGQFSSVQDYIDNAETTIITDKKTLVNKYILNIFRFFSLNRRNVLTKNPFKELINISNFSSLGIGAEKTSLLNDIATYYFNQKFYDEAASSFEKLVAENSECEPMIFQKLGYCYQHLGKYTKAIEAYNRYELFSEDVWLFKQMALCYKMLHNHEKALSYYRKAEKCNSENASLCMSIGHELLSLNNAAEALKYYFKGSYLTNRPSAKYWRPIAWCSFLLHNFEQSEKYYSKIESNELTADDHLNMGHVFLLKKEIAKATEQYHQYMTITGCSLDNLEKAIEQDEDYILGESLDNTDFHFLLDAIILKIRAKSV